MVETTRYMEPIWLSVLLLLSATFYVATALGAIYRLAKRHRGIWEDMGRPFEMPPLTSQTFGERWSAMWRSLVFVLLSGRHHMLEDPSLTALIFAARLSGIVTLFVWLLVGTIGHQVITVREL